MAVLPSADVVSPFSRSDIRVGSQLRIYSRGKKGISQSSVRGRRRTSLTVLGLSRGESQVFGQHRRAAHTLFTLTIPESVSITSCVSVLPEAAQGADDKLARPVSQDVQTSCSPFTHASDPRPGPCSAPAHRGGGWASAAAFCSSRKEKHQRDDSTSGTA